MTCKIEYEEMMSLQLDGLLSPQQAQDLEAHTARCSECAPAWEALHEADALLWASTQNPPPLPEGFHASVMSRIAVLPVQVAYPVPVIPNPVATIFPPSSLPIHPLDGSHEWQHRLSGYLRAAAAVSLSLVGTAGLLVVLVMSGTLDLGGPVSSITDVFQTLVSATGTWLRSLTVGLGPAALTVGGLLAGLLVFIGWQVVTGYHRSALDAGAFTFAEAAA